MAVSFCPFPPISVTTVQRGDGSGLDAAESSGYSRDRGGTTNRLCWESAPRGEERECWETAPRAEEMNAGRLRLGVRRGNAGRLLPGLRRGNAGRLLLGLRR